MALQDTLDQLRGLEIADLDVNNIGGWPGPLKAIILVVLFVVVVVAGYFFYLTDKQTVLEAAQKQEAALRSEYESKAFQAANLPQYRQQKDEMEASFGTMLRQLPSDTEVPGLIEDITLAALDNGLVIESIDLQPERKAEFYVELADHDRRDRRISQHRRVRFGRRQPVADRDAARFQHQTGQVADGSEDVDRREDVSIPGR